MIYDSIATVIGSTPVVRLQRVSQRVGCQVFAKLECFNPGGSHKSRIAMAMVLDAEQRGVLHRGSGQTLLEPSGGNTGMGLAIVANLFGYRLILVIPDNYSPEKRRLLEYYGAHVVLSDSSCGNNSHVDLAIEILREHPEYVMLDQLRNPANPKAHRETAREILDALGATPIDCFVGGIGSGGHITGIGEMLKAHRPQTVVFGVEPEGCCLLENRHAPHGIQGLSVGMIPHVLNISVLDGMVAVSKDECIRTAHQIVREEGISMGLSSAANFVAIAKLAANRLAPGSSVLTVVYDGAEHYLDHFDCHCTSNLKNIDVVCKMAHA